MTTADRLTRTKPGFYIVFDGPPGPEPGRFIEVETEAGESVGPDHTGASWAEMPNDGLWQLGPFALLSSPEPAFLRGWDAGYRLAEERSDKERAESYAKGHADALAEVRAAVTPDAMLDALCASDNGNNPFYHDDPDTMALAEELSVAILDRLSLAGER